MHARVTIARFQPDARTEATTLLREVILPSAQAQTGFRGALVLGAPAPDRGLIITLWDTEADLTTSQPPDVIAADVEGLGQVIADATQENYEVFVQL